MLTLLGCSLLQIGFYFSHETPQDSLVPGKETIMLTRGVPLHMELPPMTLGPRSGLQKTLELRRVPVSLGCPAIRLGMNILGSHWPGVAWEALICPQCHFLEA